MQSVNLKKMVLVAFSIALTFFFSNISFAQETPPSKPKSLDVKPQTEQKQMSWDEYKADLKARYQKVSDQVAAIEKQAAEKKIEAPDFKELVNRVHEQAKEFNIHLKNADALPVERQEQFRADTKVQLDRLNSTYDELNSKWATLNK